MSDLIKAGYAVALRTVRRVRSDQANADTAERRPNVCQCAMVTGGVANVRHISVDHVKPAQIPTEVAVELFHRANQREAGMLVAVWLCGGALGSPWACC
ncbi:MAG: hypothetical protein VCB59_08995 [Gammaproteobacteria bacterium]